MAFYGARERPSRTSSPVPAIDPHHDPFVAVASPPSSSHHRFSNFDSQIFALGPNASQIQAKKALEAHLAETDRRMEEAGKLGTALVQQRKELSDRLREVEKLQAEEELSDDLRQKLAEIEKDYNDVARESARAFLPKQRVPSNEVSAGSPFVPEGKGGRRSVSPSKFEAQATGSPTKFSVPNRKLRNQPANRIHDIEFAAEISQSLIAQVRNLQGLLAEKEEELKEIKNEKSKLEYEAEGFQQRVKNLDESEHRYKDENWSLETQVHDLMAKEREAQDREKKLNQALNMLQAEKTFIQRELDEVKMSHSKLSEEHATSMKHHDIELGTAKRNIVIAESERTALRKKIDDLTGQNQELAKAVSASQRARIIERESILGMADEGFETAHDKTTPEHSPPPSPVKGTPRHSMLESETLKTSLGHAQRTIQGLRNNVHREKTEKLELKRMLQDARDELEKLRHDPIVQNKRARKTESREFKKPLRLLGGPRTVRSEVFSEDSNWEDQPDSTSPTRSSLASRGSSKFQSVAEEPCEQFETANETSDAAFETAHEPSTETDDFHTGAEEFSSDSDDDEDALTETESPSKRRTPRNRQPSFIGLNRSGSLHSTASTEDDEDYPFDQNNRTPTKLPPLQPKFPLRVGRGALRRSRQPSEEPAFPSSPPSVTSSTAGTPQQRIQSLAAELGDFNSDNDSTLSATPSRRSYRGRTMSPSPPPPVPPLPKVIMVDNGTMTDDLNNRPMSLDTAASRFSTSSYGSVAHDLDAKLAKFPSPPTSPPKKDMGVDSAQNIESLPRSDAHAADFAALQAQHERALKEFSDEKAAAYAAAVEELKSQHAEQLNKAQADANWAHTQEIATLKSSHADEVNRSISEVQAAHARELENLKSSHTDDIAKAVSDAQAAYAQELEMLKSAHAEEISKVIAEANATHAKELESLRLSHVEESNKSLDETRAVHAREVEELRSSYASQAAKAAAESQALHAQELDALKASLAEQASQKELDSNAAHEAELEALKTSHAEQIAMRESEIKATHASELESLKMRHADEISNVKNDSESRHAAEIAALVAAHSGQVDQLKTELFNAHAQQVQALQADYAEQLGKARQQSDESHSQELEALKATHSKQIEEVKSTLVAAHATELDSIRAAHAKHLEDLKKENDALHAAEIAALIASHSKQIDSVKADSQATLAKELAALKEAHAQEIDALNSQHAATRAQELEAFKAAIDKQIESSQSEGDAAHTKQIEALNAAHAEVLEAQKRDSETSQTQALESLKAAHERNIEALKSEHAALRSKELDDMLSTHLRELEAVRQEHESSKTQALASLVASHTQQLEELRQNHLKELADLSSEHESAKAKLVEELTNSQSQEVQNLNRDIESKAAEITALTAHHAKVLDAHKAESQEAVSQKEREIERLRVAQEEAHAKVLLELRNAHSRDMEKVLQDGEDRQSTALEAQKNEHSRELEEALARVAEALRAEHANVLESLKKDYSEERERLMADHTAELEALRESLTVAPPTLGFSPMTSTETEPIEARDLRSPRREAFIIPREDRHQQTPAIGLLGRKGERAATPEIAEDETRQSPNATPGPETPESQRPFKEMSTNTNVRPSRKSTIPTSDQGAQTTLTSNGLDQLLSQSHTSEDSVTITTARGEVTVTPFDEARAKQRAGEGSAVSAPDAIPQRRPGSSASARGSAANMPPLPPNHREAIEAARTNSAGGGKGTMGPPLLPASAYKPSTPRPETPSTRRPMSASSVRGTPTPRAGRSSTPGYADAHSARLAAPSRQSSMSSFTSEVETRFNMRNEMGIDAAAFGPNTDPRMIQAITQTMIGEYLWKYTRKTGRGEMSENRHRRYFWVHPYTRTLYWSERDPSDAGRTELKAKSVPIEAVRIVGDDNPMPPGLHRKSLIIVSPGRTVKFTCTTGQRHETWYNALSYLLLRTGEEHQADAEDVAGQITQEDVDEFNPSLGRRPANGTRARAPPSLSSYHSRTTVNNSPNVDISMRIPTLTPTRERETARTGTLGRLSGYWKSSSINSTFSSLRSRSHLTPQDSAIYEASEVPDSAEDVRQIMEQQDRDADRMENVRACCDGKHDVSLLDHKRSRLSNSHSHSHMHPGRSSTPTPKSTTRTRA
ncbi:uncharacterized protein F4807DRAFT_386938 [Annulohypoxylon truncatum]|uniref:uncharacterized protein n=1 Tax=Annulohypoxylon truncatum TaxID=327061 RepID=UPI00200831EC|nr:uncharacterized protein F4807DRAFT_386938 [Annulohypoxylon truncatum]KAI1212064.1 hypothetical protein F4807DRAFT_386938 [Annulohypoxylon truncatum]